MKSYQAADEFAPPFEPDEPPELDPPELDPLGVDPLELDEPSFEPLEPEPLVFDSLDVFVSPPDDPPESLDFFVLE